MKNLKDVFNSVSFEDVYKVIRDSYENPVDSEEGFKEVFNRIANYPNPDDTSHPYVLSINKYKDDFDPEIEFYSVSGYDLIEEQSNGVGFELDQFWASLEVPDDIVLSPAEIVAHCLWEMTFYAWNDEDKENIRKELLETEYINIATGETIGEVIDEMCSSEKD